MLVMNIIATYDKLLTDEEIEFYLSKGYMVELNYIEKKTYIIQ